MKKLKIEEIMYSIIGSVFAVIIIGEIVQKFFDPSNKRLIFMLVGIFIVTFLIMIKMNLAEE